MSLKAWSTLRWIICSQMIGTTRKIDKISCSHQMKASYQLVIWDRDHKKMNNNIRDRDIKQPRRREAPITSSMKWERELISTLKLLSGVSEIPFQRPSDISWSESLKRLYNLIFITRSIPILTWLNLWANQQESPKEERHSLMFFTRWKIPSKSCREIQSR